MASLQPGAAQADASASGQVQTCRNCGAPAPGNFCPQCGQETARDPRSVAQDLRGLVARTLAEQGQLWRTLSKLVFSPGALTIEHRVGRRARYLRPLQLYLMASVFVFATVQVFGLNLGLRFYGEQGIHLLRNSRLPATAGRGQGLQATALRVLVNRLDTPGIRRFRALPPDDRFAFLRARRAPYVSYFVLFLVPVFALTLGLFYRSRRRRYVEHLVFGLHCQTFLLVMLLVEATLPAILANAVSAWVAAYFAVALKHVYGGTWAETLGRGTILLLLYFGIFFGANLLLVFALLTL